MDLTYLSHLVSASHFHYEIWPEESILSVNRKKGGGGVRKYSMSLSLLTTERTGQGQNPHTVHSDYPEKHLLCPWSAHVSVFVCVGGYL